MAKTVNPAKKSPPADTPEDVLDDETTTDAEDSAQADDEGADEEEEDLSLDVDPTANAEPAPRALTTTGEAGVTARPGAGGIYVPPALMANSFTRWFAEAYIELRKVTWPETREAWNMSLVVVAVSVVMAALLAAADFGLGHLLSYFVSLGLGK